MFIELGIWLLGVPLVVPLAVLIFFGGLFPIVGAFVSSLFAVFVALADGGLGTELTTLAVVVAVQHRRVLPGTAAGGGSGSPSPVATAQPDQ